MNNSLPFIIAGIVGVYLMSYSPKKLPRGIRNNNPGNIRISKDNWNGAIGDDGSFIKFVDPVYGIRAMARILDSYRDRGVTHLIDIISTWAPSSENNVGAYVTSVEKYSGLYSNQVIEKKDYIKLIPAIIFHENGQQPYTPDLIKTAIMMAN